MTSIVRGNLLQHSRKLRLNGLKVTMERTRLNVNRNLAHTQKLFSAHHKRQYEPAKSKPEVTSHPRSKWYLLKRSYLAIFPRIPAMPVAADVPEGSPGSFITGAWLSSAMASGGVKRRPAGAKLSLMRFSRSLDIRCTPWWHYAYK